MPILNIKTPDGQVKNVEIDNFEITLREVTNLLNSKYYSAETSYIFVANGAALDDSVPLSSLGLNDRSSVIIVVRHAAASAAPAPAPAPAVTVGTRSEASESAQTLSAYQYHKVYNGAEVSKAIDRDSNILFNVMKLIAQKNPFFLSYLAVNPQMAREHLNATLESDEFVMNIYGDDDTCDPIAPLLVHPFGVNYFETDQSNIEFLMSQSQVQSTYDTVKELYLFHDRKISKVLESLKDKTMLVVN